MVYWLDVIPVRPKYYICLMVFCQVTPDLFLKLNHPRTFHSEDRDSGGSLDKGQGKPCMIILSH